MRLCLFITSIGLSGKAYFTAKQQDELFGALDLRFTNDGTKVEGKFYPKDGSKPIQDQFTITKSVADATPPTVTSTTPSGGATGVAVTSSIKATFSEAVLTTNFVGVDTFTYTVSDGKGKIDRAKVSVIVKRDTDNKPDRTNQQTDTSTNLQSGQEDNKIQPNNHAGSSRDNDLKAPAVQNNMLTNETSSNG